MSTGALLEPGDRVGRAGSDRPAAASPKITAEREPDTRYAKLLGTYRAARLEDPYSPTAPSLIARRFDFDREMPEARVEAMLEQIVGSPLVPRVAKLIERRLGRPLEPFDIWYNGFLPRGKYTEAELDAITKKKYPTAGAFAADIPAILVKLGFSQERAGYLASNIEVDPSRGAGHAWGAQRRGDKAHLRTRVGADGMDYKGYNIAVHELGHNVEQTFSLNEIATTRSRACRTPRSPRRSPSSSRRATSSCSASRSRMRPARR